MNGSTDYINIPSGFTNTIKGDNTYTIEMWVKPNSLSNSPVILDGNSTGSYGFWLELGNATNQIFFWASGGNQRIYSGTILTTGVWHHIVVSKTGAGDSGNLYIDGVLQASYAGSLGDTSNANSDFLLGKYRSGGFEFNGQIDEVRISDTTRTIPAIPQQTPFTPDSNTKGLWHLDNDAGDSSGVNNGTLNGSPFYSEGKVIKKVGLGAERATNEQNLVGVWRMNESSAIHGSTIDDAKGSLDATLDTSDGSTNKATAGKLNGGINLDGTNDYASVPSSNLDVANSWSFSTWYKQNAPTDNKGIFQIGENMATPQANNFKLVSNYVYVSNSSGSIFKYYSGIPTSTNWTHMAVTWDGTNLKVYQNGVDITGLLTKNTDNAGSMANTNRPVYLGAEWNGALASSLNGIIDETALYSGVLSADDVRSHYNAKNEVWFKTQSAINASSTSEASGNHSYYMYYDNNSATNPPENKDNIYALYDSFDGASLDASKWNSTGSVSVANSQVTIQNTNAEIYSINTYEVGYVIEGWGKLDDQAASGDAVIGFNNDVQDANAIEIYSYNKQAGAGSLTGYTEQADTGNSVSLDEQESSSYRKWDIMRASSSLVNFQVDGGAIKNVSTNIPTGAYSVNLYTRYASDIAVFDWILVRKYAANEPTLSFGSEELSSGAVYLSPGVWTSDQITATGLYGNWVQMTFTDTEPAGTDVKYRVYQSDGSTLIPDGVLSGNSTGFDTSPVDMSGVSVDTYDNIIIKATLTTTDGLDTPVISALTMSYTYDVTPPTGTALSWGTVSATTIDITASGAADTESGLRGDGLTYYIERDNGATTFATADANSGWITGLWSQPGLTSNTAYSYRVKARDAEGNESGWVTPTPAYKYTLASTPTLNAPTTPTNDNTPTITGTGASASVTVKLYDNGTEKASTTSDGTGNFTFGNTEYGASTLSDGNHTNITARSLNADSVESPDSNAVTIFVDTQVPATTMTTNPATPDGQNGYFNTNPTITLSISDPAPSAGNGTTYYKWDDPGFSSPLTYSAPFDMLSSVGTGTHILYWRTTDTAGNQENIQSQQVKLSNIVPAPSSVAVDYTQSQSQTVNQFRFGWDHPVGVTATAYYYKINTPPTQGSATAITTFTSCSISGITYDVCTPFFAAAMVNGLNTFYVVTQDDAMSVGWSQQASQNFSINVVQDDVKVPVNISLSDSSNRATSKWAITASWDAPSPQDANFTSYIIERSENGSSWVSAGETTATAYADTGLDTAKSYYYRVKLKTTFGELSDPITTMNPLQPTGKFITPPTIVSGPSVSKATANSATIIWSTNRSSSSFVEYGTTTNYGASNGQLDAVTSHSVTLSGLNPATTYNFRVQSLDEDRDYPVTQGYSANNTFKTSDAPSISEVTVADITLSSAILSWKTNTVSTSAVNYGKTASYGSTLNDESGSSVTTHTVKLTDLDHTNTYNFKVTGADTDGNVLSSDNYVFSTLTFPRISNVKYTQIKEASSATYEFTWDSNVTANSILEYKEKPFNSARGEGSDSVKEAVSSAYVTSHKLKIGGLKDNADYIITVKGRDEHGNESTTETVNLKTDLDTRAPAISDVTVETSILGAGKESKGQMIISWMTDEPSTSQVEYGVGVAGDSYSSKTQEDTTFTTSHVVIISDLAPSTSYHFRVISKDNSGNKGESKDNSALTEQASDSVIDIIINSLEKTVGWIFKILKKG